MKFLDKINLFFLLLFFTSQNNFFLTHKLCSDWGQGIGLYRSSILILNIAMGCCLIFLNLILNNTNKSFKKVQIIIFILIIISILIHLFIDYRFDNIVDFIGVAPLAEAIFMIIYCSLILKPNLLFSKNTINFISFLIFSNICIELFFYFSDLISGISYGPFRANINGIVMNRNPSFFYPIFALILLIFYDFNKILKYIYILLYILYILSFFYRTIYIALIIPVLFDRIYFFKLSSKSLIKLFKTIFILFVVCFTFIIFIDSYVELNYGFSILKVFLGRLSSTGVDINVDPAQYQRIDQLPQIIFKILLNPLGIGFNGLILGSPVYLFAYYPFHPILYLGWIFVIPLLYYYRSYILIFSSLKYRLKSRIILMCLNYFIIVLIFFPYMTYFTFTSIIILLFSMQKKSISIVNY